MRNGTIKRYNILYGKFNNVQIMSCTVSSTLFFNCCERLCDLADSAENWPFLELLGYFCELMLIMLLGQVGDY